MAVAKWIRHSYVSDCMMSRATFWALLIGLSCGCGGSYSTAVWTEDVNLTERSAVGAAQSLVEWVTGETNVWTVIPNRDANAPDCCLKRHPSNSNRGYLN